MAIETAIGGSGLIFIGEDKRIYFGPLQTPQNWNATLSGAYSPPDMSSWDIEFWVRKKDGSPDPGIVGRNIDGFVGVYNADVDLNTQRGYVQLTDDEMNLFSVLKEPYRYSFKRMDSGFETVLAFGDFAPQRATAPDKVR